MKYRKGYKYQLAEDFETTVAWHLGPIGADVITEFLELKHATFGSSYTMLLVKRGYAWDGPSGPTIDTASFMIGSLVHDALYQLMREGHISSDSATRIAADVELIRHCKKSGMSWIRRSFVWCALRLFGGRAADPKHDRKVIEVS